MPLGNGTCMPHHDTCRLAEGTMRRVISDIPLRVRRGIQLRRQLTQRLDPFVGFGSQVG